MSSTRKVAIGLGIAGGALLAAWLLTGTRKKKTKDFLTRATADLKKSVKAKPTTPEDPEHYYV
jgi:hypothetical protein